MVLVDEADGVVMSMEITYGPSGQDQLLVPLLSQNSLDFGSYNIFKLLLLSISFFSIFCFHYL